MRIEPNLGPNAGQPTDSVANVSTANTSQAARPLQSTAQNSADQANLSSDAQQLSSLSGALASVPAIRQDRVAPLSQAVQSGTYSVSNQQIAQSLVRDFRTTNSVAQT
jgi:negative regulator of flagellin synthesis FlgM